MTDLIDLQIDCNLNWKTHVECVIPKLNYVHCVMRRFTALIKIQNLEVVYFAYLHHCIWGNHLGRFNRQ
jgi:hypothetical protein